MPSTITTALIASISPARDSRPDWRDEERFVSFVEMTYRDRVVGTGGLAPRQGC